MKCPNGTQRKGGDTLSGKETGAVAVAAIVVALFYFAIVGGFTFSIELTMIQRIEAFVIGFVITIAAVAIGPRM